jgi:acyl carrier protein
MQRVEIVEKLHSILISVLKLENVVINDELSAANVDGWDSLTHMVIITEIENRFGVRFKLRELNKLTNMGNLISLIASKTN